MAKEYKCVRCGKPAVIHITRISGNEKITLHFCEECAKKLALDNPDSPAAFIPEISEFDRKIAEKTPPEICPTCGTQMADIKRGDKFGCPDCYATMDAYLMDMLAQMHCGKTRHTGKKPAVHGANVDISKALAGVGEDSGADIAGGDIIDELDAAVSSAMEAVADAEQIADSPLQPELPFAENLGGAENKSAEKNGAAPTLAELQNMLDEAVRQERYEDAAKLRDQINSLPKS